MDSYNYPKIKDVIDRYKLNADKKLGQNFLFDQNLTDKIVRLSGSLQNFIVIEIGPGPGLLTRSILSADVKKLIAIEKDIRCINALNDYLVPQSNGRLEIIEDDALKSDIYFGFDHKVKIIANLPYNISTELLFKWLDNLHNFQSFTLMFQKEVAMRICAKPRTKEYGRVSVKTQILCDVEHGFDLPPNAFFPPPKVNSTILHIKPKKEIVDKSEIQKLDQILKNAFGQRRKTLRSSLKPLLKDNPDLLRNAEIDSSKRAEELSVNDFRRLAQIIK